MKQILDYVQDTEPRRPIMVKFKMSFFKEVDQQRKKDNLTWYDLFTAAMQRYLEERKGK